MLSNLWKTVSMVFIGIMLLGLTLIMVGFFVVSTTILFALAGVVVLVAILSMTARKLESRVRRALEKIR